jgi:hypothetical protein
VGWRRVCRFIFLLACRTAREGVGLLVFDLDTYARVLDLTRRERAWICCLLNHSSVSLC